MMYQFRSLAQGALRLEEVQQSLQSEIFAPAQQMQTGQVLQPIYELRRQTANTQHQMHLLKQKVPRFTSDLCRTRTTRLQCVADGIRVLESSGKQSKEISKRIRKSISTGSFGGSLPFEFGSGNEWRAGCY